MSLGHPVAEDDEEVLGVPGDDVVVLQLGQARELSRAVCTAVNCQLYFAKISQYSKKAPTTKTFILLCHKTAHRAVGVVVCAPQHPGVGQTDGLPQLLVDRAAGALQR